MPVHDGGWPQSEETEDDSPVNTSLPSWNWSTTTSSTCRPWSTTTSSTLALGNDEMEEWRDLVEGVIPTTFTSSMVMHAPNYGLDPVVGPARANASTMGVMAITNGEISGMQENGVPRDIIRRVEDLLQCLDDMQADGRGPEHRWGLGRLVRRADEAVDATGAIVEVLRRRLQPRGLLPVQRRPRNQVARLRMFNWAQQFTSIFNDCMAQHLRTRLQPGEDTEVDGISQSSSSSSLHGGSMQSRDRSRTPGRRLSDGDSPRDSEVGSSEYAYDSDQNLVAIPPARPGTPRNGPLPPTPVNLPASTASAPVVVPSWVTLEPVGIWREVEEDATTTTTTSTTLTGDEAADMAVDGVTLENGSDDAISMVQRGIWTLTMSTSSTTTTTSELTWPSEVVRDTVNVNLVHGGLVDVVELIHRLQARQRHLRPSHGRD